MNSTLADSNSALSCATRVVKNGSTKVKPRTDFYLWMFGQIHAKRLLIYLQFVLLGAAIYGFISVADPYFSTLPVPGLDGISISGATDGMEGAVFVNNSEAARLDILGKTPARKSDPATARRLLVFAFSLLYFTSVLCTLCALSCMDRTWYPGLSKFKNMLNPGLLLLPFMTSFISFSLPLVIWTARRCRHLMVNNCALGSNAGCLGSSTVLEILVFTLIPILIIWTIFAYFLYGCTLGFVYVWRRSRYLTFTEPAAASFSWSFRERNGMLGLHTNSFSHFKPNRSFNGRGASWKSIKSTDRPTLRSYISRPNDLNSSRSSLISGDMSLCDDALLNDAISITMQSSDQVSTSYAGFPANIAVRRPLATVLEEGESHEGTGECSISLK